MKKEQKIDDKLEQLAELQLQIATLYSEVKAILKELKPDMDVARGKHTTYSLTGSEHRLRITHRCVTRENWEVIDNKKPYKFMA